MIRSRFTGRSRRSIVVLSAAILALAIGAPVLAGHLGDGVKSYTGCLTTQGGTLTLIREGDAPAKPCPSGSTQAHFSGGDITGVTAGFGLTGGGTNGSVSIALDPKYGLRQDCADGQILEWNDTAGAWTCAEDDDTTYTAGDGLVLNGTEFSLDGDSLLPDCSLGESATVVSSDQSAFGTWGCLDKADADQACSSGQFATGLDENGGLTCAAPSGGSAAPAVWMKEVSYADAPDLPPGDSPVQISLDVPNGSYFVAFTAIASDDFHGNSEVNISCITSVGSAAAQDYDPGDLTIAATGIYSGSGPIYVSCSSNGGSDHLENLNLTAIKLGTVTTQ